MLSVQRALAILMAASAVVCGCSCSSKSGSHAPRGTSTAADARTLTAAQGNQIRGRYVGSLQVSRDGAEAATVAMTVAAVGGLETGPGGSSSEADHVADQSYNAKLEVASTGLNVSLLSTEIRADEAGSSFTADFVMQNQATKDPLKLKFNFTVENGRLQGRLEDGSDLQTLLGDTGSSDAAALAGATGSASATDLERRHHPVPKPKHRPSPKSPPSAPAPTPAPEEPTRGTMFLDLRRDERKNLPVIDPATLRIPTATYFSGTTNFGNGTTKPVDLIIQEPDVTSDLAFYGRVATQGLKRTFVTVQANYGNDAVLPYQPALLDPATGAIKGISFIGSDSSGHSGVLQLDCTSKPRQTLDCSLLTDGKPVAQSHLTSAQGPTQAMPGDGTSNSVVRVYKGTARFVNGQDTAVDLNIGYDANSALESILSLLQPTRPHSQQLKVTFFLTGTVSGVPFPDVVFDEKAQTLTATTSFVRKDTRVVASFACTGFTFGPPDSKFQCVYKNTLLNGPVPFVFPGTAVPGAASGH